MRTVRIVIYRTVIYIYKVPPTDIVNVSITIIIYSRLTVSLDGVYMFFSFEIDMRRIHTSIYDCDNYVFV